MKPSAPPLPPDATKLEALALYEALSRLLDDDLDPADAVALRARIASEPEVARAWQAMSRLPVALGALRETEPPSVSVPGGRPGSAPVLAPPASPSRSAPRSGTALWAALALAAGLTATLIMPAAHPEIVLGRGTSLVEGRADVLVGDLVIEIDGKSQITVEPLAGELRDAGQEAKMDRTHLLAAFVGAAVSLTVDQGSAIIRSPGSEPVTVTSGQTRTLGQPKAQPRSRVVGGADPRIADLEHELAGLKLQHAFQQAQLNSANGTAAEFPENLPAAYRPEEFERNIRAALQGAPGVDLMSMNCEEYPCIAILRTTDTGEDWGQKLSALGQSIRDDAYGESSGLHEDSELLHGPDGDVRVMAFSTTAPGSEDENVGSRRQSRVKGLMEGIGEKEE